MHVDAHLHSAAARAAAGSVRLQVREAAALEVGGKGHGLGDARYHAPSIDSLYGGGRQVVAEPPHRRPVLYEEFSAEALRSHAATPHAQPPSRLDVGVVDGVVGVLEARHDYQVFLNLQVSLWVEIIC